MVLPQPPCRVARPIVSSSSQKPSSSSNTATSEHNRRSQYGLPTTTCQRFLIPAKAHHQLRQPARDRVEDESALGVHVGADGTLAAAQFDATLLRRGQPAVDAYQAAELADADHDGQ